MALRRAQRIAFQDDTGASADDALIAAEPADDRQPTPLFLDRRDGGDRRQTERRGLDSLRTEYQRSLLANTEEADDGLRASFALPFGLKPSRLALILVAVIAGGIAAYLAMSREPAPAPAATISVKVAATPMTKVLVAKSDVAIGQRITADMLQWQDWPDAAIHPGFITDTADPQAAKDVAGRLVRATLLAGEPVRQEKLATGAGGLLSSLLDKGMRGVSVQITAESASGGFVLPEDRVDVVLTHQAPDGRPELQTILSNVRVLAINANLGAPNGSAPAADGSAKGFADQAIATLELNEAQSQVIIKATTMGKLSLTLRSTADAPTAEAAEEQAANAAIRISSPFWAK